ncbi:MAG TPA: lipid II flippase MurJ [Solirubrobacteraceae bacterium]|nr:lipid II flippase MurJ [Solirubrobacteraceae bacterium]
MSAEPAIAQRSPLLRTAIVVGAIVAGGNLLGFVRDMLIAALFGATAKTDAFMTAWTIPETTSSILMEGALAFVLIPLLSREIAQRGELVPVIRRTLAPLLLLVAALSLATLAGAPVLVQLLAPGLRDPHAAITCLRLAAGTVFFMGAAGYLSAVLESEERFLVPALVYVAYNVGIITTTVMFHRTFGVLAAAAGLTIGAACMLIVQLPLFVRRLGGLRQVVAWSPSSPGLLVALLPAALFFAVRQSQVWVERFLGSFLPSGAITHLNYASKTAQVPVTLTLALATVSFPTICRLLASGDRERSGRALEHVLATALALVIPATVCLILFAPGIVAGLYQRGQFLPGDAHATATIMRVYSTGLPAQVVVSIAVLPFFGARRLWPPVRVAVVGVLVGAAVSLALLRAWGADAIAAGNAAGITLMGILLLSSLHRHLTPVDIRRLAAAGARVAVVSCAAGAGGYLVASLLPGGVSEPPGAFTGLAAVGGLYVATGVATGVAEIEPILDALRNRPKQRRFA